MESLCPVFLDNVAYKLKLWRVEQGWSLDMAGDRAGMEGTAISRIESGVHEYKINAIVDIVERYGMPYEYVFMHYEERVLKELWRKLNMRAQELGGELRKKKKERKRNGERVEGMGVQLELF